MIRTQLLAIGTLVLLTAAIPEPLWSSEEDPQETLAERAPDRDHDLELCRLRQEVGTNLVGEVTRFLIGVDPGIQEGCKNVAIPLRLAFVGFDGPQGRVAPTRPFSIDSPLGRDTLGAAVFYNLSWGLAPV